MDDLAAPATVDVTVELDEALVAEARALGLDLSALTAGALGDAVRQAKAAAWAEENREALAQRRARIERDGLPLQEFRRF
jgi:antitoxin CcdA